MNAEVISASAGGGQLSKGWAGVRFGMVLELTRLERVNNEPDRPDTRARQGRAYPTRVR